MEKMQTENYVLHIEWLIPRCLVLRDKYSYFFFNNEKDNFIKSIDTRHLQLRSNSPK